MRYSRRETWAMPRPFTHLSILFIDINLAIYDIQSIQIAIFIYVKTPALLLDNIDKISNIRKLNTTDAHKFWLASYDYKILLANI